MSRPGHLIDAARSQVGAISANLKELALYCVAPSEWETGEMLALPPPTHPTPALPRSGRNGRSCPHPRPADMLPFELRRMILRIYKDGLHARALLAELRAVIEFTRGEPGLLLREA